MAYTDGSGADGTKAAGMSSEGPSGTRNRSYGGFLGPTTSVADAERLRMALGLEREPGLLAITSDCQAVLATLHRLAAGDPPNSGIEKRLKDGLADKDREVGALGQEPHRHPRELTGRLQSRPRRDPRLPSGQPGAHHVRRIKRTGKGQKEGGENSPRVRETPDRLGKTRPTYTWTRTNKGPQKSWLHHIGKTEDPSCACGHPTQDGDILVFHCPLMAPQRAQLLPLDISTWETLDDPHWIAEAGGDDDDDDEFRLLFALKGHVEPAGIPTGFKRTSS